MIMLENHHHHLEIVLGRLYKSVLSKFQQSCWRLCNGLIIPLSHSLTLKTRRSRIDDDEKYDDKTDYDSWLYSMLVICALVWFACQLY